MHNRNLVAGSVMSLLLGLGAVNAQAAVLTLAPGSDGLTFGFVPSAGTNQALPLFGISANGDAYGWYGAVVTGLAGASYKYDVYGAEAGFRNRFSVDGTAVYTHGGGNNLSLMPKATYNGNTLNFSFLVNNSSPLITNDLSATGNRNNSVANVPNFFASFDLFASTAGSNPLTGDVLWLFLDDGNAVDDNHDDLLVRITATAPGAVVPLPASLPLLAAATGLVGVIRRRSAPAKG